MSVQLDTGSSDLIVTSSNVPVCSQSGQCLAGTFDPSKSSTYELIQSDTMNTSYGDGSGYTGDYFTDHLALGEVPVDGLTMGLATALVNATTYANDGTGIIGMNYAAGSGFSNVFNGSLPETPLSVMVKSGTIARQAYSVSLGSKAAAGGSIIFGGVDSTHYTGDLVALQVVPSPNDRGNYTALAVPLTGMSVTDVNGTQSLTDSSFGIPANFDTGTSYQNLPYFIAKQLFDGLGVTKQAGSFIIPCSRARANVTVNYHFGGDGGPTINGPLSELISDSSGQYGDGEDQCNMEISDSTFGTAVLLGDNFLRSGYFVYDLDNNVIAIAQAATSAASTGSVTVLSSGTDIPGCTSTNTYTLDPSQLSQTSGYSAPTDTTSTDASATVSSPATPTFDLGSVTTETAVSTSTDSVSSSSSHAGVSRMPVMTMMPGMDKRGIIAAAALVALL